MISDNNENYRTDRLEVIQNQQEQAMVAIEQIEKKTSYSPIEFLKSNYDNKKVRERKNEPNIMMVFSVLFNKIMGMAGISTRLDEFNATDITKMIFNLHSELTIEEIYKAFELERHFGYEEKTEHYNLFNADYISKIFMKYKKWKQNQKHIHNISPPKQIPEMTDSEKKQIIDNGIIRKYNEYVETQSIEEPFVYIFDELIERNVIKSRGENTPSLDQYYQNKINQAHLEITKELKNFTSADKSERNSVKAELERVINGSSNKVEIRAKRIILGEFFTKVIRSGNPIEKIIK